MLNSAPAVQGIIEIKMATDSSKFVSYSVLVSPVRVLTERMDLDELLKVSLFIMTK